MLKETLLSSDLHMHMVVVPDRAAAMEPDLCRGQPEPCLEVWLQIDLADRRMSRKGPDQGGSSVLIECQARLSVLIGHFSQPPILPVAKPGTIPGNISFALPGTFINTIPEK